MSRIKYLLFVVVCLFMGMSFVWAQDVSSQKKENTANVNLSAVSSSKANKQDKTNIAAGNVSKDGEKGASYLHWIMGVVKKIDLKQKRMDVLYYDFENDKDEVMQVYVTKKTQFLGAGSLPEIEIGEDVEVSFSYTKDGLPIAEAIITSSFSGQIDEESDSQK